VTDNAEQAMAAGSAQVPPRVKLAQSQPQELARLVHPINNCRIEWNDEYT
jgi:hypothetical protein